MLDFNLKAKYMRKNYQHLLSLFFMSFVLNSVTSIVCLAEERREDKPAEDTLSAYVIRGNELPTFSIIGQDSAKFNYQGFTAGIRTNVDTKQYFVGTLDIVKIFVLFEIDSILSPTLTFYKEINSDSQWSALLKVSHTYEFNKSVSLKSSASAGNLNRQEKTFTPNYDGWEPPMMDNYDGTISVSLPIAVTESFSFVPSFTYVFPLGNNSRHDLRGKGIVNPLDKSSSFVYGGISLSFTF